MAIHSTIHFLQNGAPCHDSTLIKNYLSDKPFHVIDWPDNCPVLNSIKNCWRYMKGKLKDRDIGSCAQADQAVEDPLDQPHHQGLLQEAERLYALQNSTGDTAQVSAVTC
jgi:hypothetical protein